MPRPIIRAAAERYTNDILQIVPSGPFGKAAGLLQADKLRFERAETHLDSDALLPSVRC